MNFKGKRIAAALLCLVLAVGTLFAFVGCNSAETTASSGGEGQTETGSAETGSTETPTGEVTLVGTWEGALDMSDVLNAMFAAVDETMAQYLQVEDFAVTLRYTFEEGGAYSLKMDSDSVHKAFDAVRSSLRDGMTAYLEEVAKQNDMTLDELMSQSGTTLDEMLEESLSDEALGLNEMASVSEEGTWTVENGVLSCKSATETDALKYELTKDELRLTGLASGESGGSIFPMTFRRVP